jgi:hypothetical protein
MTMMMMMIVSKSTRHPVVFITRYIYIIIRPTDMENAAAAVVVDDF